MKKIFKGILIVILIGILGIGSFFGYLYFKNVDNRNLYSLIPDDAIYILESKNLNDGWNTISKSKIWNHLKKNPYFADINESAAALDSLMKYNKTMDMLLSDRQILVSAHMISVTDYDFLFVVDVQKAGQASFLMESLNLFSDYSITNREYKGYKIIDLLDVKEKETLSLAFIDNLLVGSYTSAIVERAIDQKDMDFWINNEKFNKAKNETGTSLFNLYVNYSQIPSYLKCYMAEKSDMVEGLSQSLTTTSFSCDLQNERLNMSGYTAYNDSMPSYFLALSKVKPGKISAYNVIPENAALYVSVCFTEFAEFFDNLKSYYSTADTTNYENYNQNIKKTEKFLNVDLTEDFFSWIGEEIAFVKLKPESNAREEDVVVIIKAQDIDDAHKGLDHLLKQIKKRTPVKFKETEYMGYPINYLSIKGFFKMFLGKLFGKLERPYFTYIDDYVVFSNSDGQLMYVIDSYLKNKTLSKSASFMNFFDDFDKNANVSVFVQTPKIYQHMYMYGKNDTKESVKKNKDLFLSFEKIGFQLVSDGELFETKLITEHNPDALLDETLESFEKSAEDLFFYDYDSLQFKVDLMGVPVTENAPVQLFYNDQQVMSEGSVIDNKPHGVWKNYYLSGHLQSIIRYEEGVVKGHCIFYYDDEMQTVKAEMDFEDDKMEGNYKEYYKNGKLKALIKVKEYLFDGDAEFYYERGSVKAKGQYSEGVMDGKWKYFNESGQEIAKKKFKDGIEKE